MAILPNIDVHVPKIDLPAIEKTLFNNMMQQVKFPVIPQGSGIINTQYFAALNEQISHASCGELQKLVADAMGSLQAQVEGIASQLAFLEPIVELIHLDFSSLPKLITWIANFISLFLGPLAHQYFVYIAQLTQLATEMVSLAENMERTLSSLGNCTVSFPGFSIPIPGGDPISIPPISGGIGGIPPIAPIPIPPISPSSPIPIGAGSGIRNLLLSKALPNSLNLSFSAPA